MALGSSRFRGGAQGKFHKISFKIACKVILHHPFLLVTPLYLIILHRYFPFLFSLLVSASPVIICTILLLGTLLLHGQHQDHKLGNREERSNVTESLINGDVNDTYSADNDGIFLKDRFGGIRNEFGGIRNDIVENEVTVSRGFQCSDFDLKDIQSLELLAPNHDVTYEKTVNDKGEKSSLDVLVAEAIPSPQETRPLLDSEDPRHPQAFRDSYIKSEVESLESIHTSEDSEEDEKGDNVDDDDETPKAIDGDSPSPFAWTENDQRILQELRSSEIEKNEHLESLISRVGDEESEENEEDSIDDVDDDIDVEMDDDDDDVNGDVEKDGGKHVTLWTEEDEKNLRHLGCSELERNLRLENLLARRRAKRNFSMISERNLIDLDKIVLPFPIPPISTTRVNPFDKPDDTNHHRSGTPIPGSAPSVTLPRKNPFDSPCTSPKKTQNLFVESIKELSMEININNASCHENGSSSKGYNTMGNALKPPFVDKNRKEALFRRYESFTAGFNMMEDSSKDDIMEFDRKEFVFRRHGTFNTRTPFPSYFNPNKPVFVAEHVVEEEWHPSLDRQLSRDIESVESETSSDTETSTAPIDHQDEEAHNEGDRTSSHIETGSESSESIDSHYDDRDEHIDVTLKVNVDHVHQELEVLHVGHDNHDHTSSSSSSEHDVKSSVNDQDEQLDRRIEVNVDHVHQEQEIFPEGHDNHDATSSSSSSEHDVKTSVNESKIEHEQVEVSAFSSKDSLNMSEASHMSMDDDHNPVEPVYDTSPSGVEKITAFSNPTQK